MNLGVSTPSSSVEPKTKTQTQSNARLYAKRKALHVDADILIMNREWNEEKEL